MNAPWKTKPAKIAPSVSSTSGTSITQGLVRVIARRPRMVTVQDLVRGRRLVGHFGLLS